MRVRRLQLRCVPPRLEQHFKSTRQLVPCWPPTFRSESATVISAILCISAGACSCRAALTSCLTGTLSTKLFELVLKLSLEYVQRMGSSRDNSAHNIFTIELSQHGLSRVHSATSPKEAIDRAAEDIQERLRQHVKLLCTPTTPFEQQVLAPAPVMQVLFFCQI